MGTSSSFKGKVGNALLPNDFSPDDTLNENKSMEEEKIDIESLNSTENINSINWTTAKTSMSKYISSAGRIGNPRNIVKNYIKASGGSSRILATSDRSRSASYRIGSILSGFVTQGIAKTLNEIGLSLRNYSLSEAMSKLVNYVEDSAMTKSDIAIRTATANTLEKILELDEGKDCLDEATANVLMQYFISELIWQQMLTDYGYSFEKYGDDQSVLDKVESNIKEYIKANVEIVFKRNKDKVFSKNMYDIVMKSCLEIMEE